MRLKLSAVLGSALLLLVGTTAAVQADTVSATSAPPLRFVSYNICGNMCSGSAYSNPQRINDVVDQASSTGWNAGQIFLQEVCKDQYDSIDSRLQPMGFHGMYTTIRSHESAVCKGLDYGVAVFVKGQIVASKELVLTSGNEVEPIKVPCVESSLQSRLNWACSVHLYWNDPTLRTLEAKKLAAQARTWQDAGIPVVLGGDFNGTPRTESLSQFYSRSVNDGGIGGFVEADETDRDYFDPSVCDPAKKSRCRSGEITFPSSASKIDYLMFSEKDFRNVQGDALPRDVKVSDHQMYRGAASWAGMSDVVAVGDLTGDSITDCIAIERGTGDLYRYSGPDYAGGSRLKIGTGWGVYDHLVGVGDLTGDGVADILAVAPDGNLYRYSGPNFNGATRQQIGNGWGSMAQLVGVGDVTGDRIPDLLAVEQATGDLYRYSGPDLAGGSRVKIGTGWNIYDTLAGVQDLTGDGVPDLLAVGVDGALYRYSGPNFNGGTRVQIGTSWNTMTNLVGVGDITGSASPDLIATENSTGDLYRYTGPDFTGGSRVKIGVAW